MKKGEESIPGKKARGGKNEKDLQRYMDELWGFAPSSGDEKDIAKEEPVKRDGDGVETPSEESEGETNDERGGKKVRKLHPRMLPHHINHEEKTYFGGDANPICESRSGKTSSGNYCDGEGPPAEGKKRKGKRGKNHPSEELTPQNEKDNFYPRDDKRRKKEEDRQKVAKGANYKEDEEEVPSWRTPLLKGTKPNAVKEKRNEWENRSYGEPKKMKNPPPDEAALLNRKTILKEKMEAKKEFMSVVHEIRKLTLPHLDKFQKKIVENHQVKMLGGKFDKSPKVHYPELMFRKKSIKRYIQERSERDRMMGVKTQTGNYIDMQDVIRRKKRMKKEKTSSKLF
ncbi:hypothetical protein PVNG_05718 [Plasmodium vivax North Korean]|uniref:Uncharacterized protein n=1 Tax=Plasmodium vivax North Korean TaxID=1035514 RepID=A0A0J9TSV7_PLAVI|nr:hypothetical protein PVNG_05718 [Plasmodium vivax North Korean]